MKKSILILICFVFLFIDIRLTNKTINNINENSDYKNQKDIAIILNSDSLKMELQPNESHKAQPFDAALYLDLYTKAIKNSNLNNLYINGGIVPHHLLAGQLTASFFKNISHQNPDLIIIFGPDHNNTTQNKIFTGIKDWDTPFGTVKTDKAIITSIINNNNNIIINDDLMYNEHSISSIIPFIKLALPNVKIVPFITPYHTDHNIIDEFIISIQNVLPNHTVTIASVDFSHYQNISVADFHDQLSQRVIQNFDYNRLRLLDVDSPMSLYFLLKMMENNKTQKIIHSDSSNSAIILNNFDLEETTSYYIPYFTKGLIESKPSASLVFFGDLMLDRGVKSYIDRLGDDYIFKDLAGKENRFFLGADVFHANLEGPFADYRRETSKEIAFQFQPNLIPMLKKYNITMFTQANNHTYDMGLSGFNESTNNLTKAGLHTYGNEYKIDSSSILIKRIGNYNIMLIGLNDTHQPIDANIVKNLLLNTLKTENQIDYIIANIHWGNEYQNVSNIRQQTLAHQLIDLGVDVIIGHHPHVIQEMEIYKNKPIFYSLGNFVFDQYFSKNTQESIAVGIIFSNNNLSTFIFPLEQNRSAVKLMSKKNADVLLDNFIYHSKIEPYLFYSNYNKINISL